MTLLTLSIVAIVAFVVFLAKRKINKRHEEIAEFELLRQTTHYKNELTKANIIMKIFVSPPKKYLSHSQQERYYSIIVEVLDYFKTQQFISQYPEYETIDFLEELEKNYSNVVGSFNSSFVNAELQRCSSFFDDIDGKALDLQQRTAIVKDEDNSLIVAGAGSGKTLTISGKVKYLCDSNRATPSQILLITFTNKAANEMNERISKKFQLNVEAKTFHKLGLEIVTRENSARPEVADFLDSLVTSYLRNHDLGYTFVNRIVVFLAYYINLPPDLVKCVSYGDYINEIRHQSLETLKGIIQKAEYEEKGNITVIGERVKSAEEAQIANFLFLHGIEYEYERAYPYKSDVTRKAYRPDFYLPEYDIYLEHFGINENETCGWLSPIESEKYIEDMHWKREFHKKHHTTLIETYSYYTSKGILLEKLEQLLVQHGVTFKEVDPKKVWQLLLDRKFDANLSQFTKLICTFITLFKANGYGKNDFTKLRSVAKEKEKTYFQRKRTLKFFDLVEPIYNAYEDELKAKGCIDFSDMINMATSIIEKKADRMSYKYIIIDEYQDISWDRARLVKAIINNTNAKLMCVGDDWQSIYRFAGSDISLFSCFSDFWGFSEIMSIEKTYRNSQELLDIAGPFVMKNPSQIQKHLTSDKRLQSPAQIVYYDTNPAGVIASILDAIVDTFGSSSSVMLLGRTNFDKDVLEEKSLFKISGAEIKYLKNPQMAITFSTVHKAKGLEADNVIIVNMKNDILGFPNQITDDPILSYVLSDMDVYPFAEERRLMYVALTRTKNAVYLLTPTQAPSCFIEELMPLCTGVNACTKILLQNNPHCPRCQTGHLLLRRSGISEKEFVACSNYPFCDYTSPHIEIITHPIVCSSCGGYMVRRQGPWGAFYGCTNYPRCRNTVEICDSQEISNDL